MIKRIRQSLSTFPPLSVRLFAACLVLCGAAAAQVEKKDNHAGMFRIGERLSYTSSFGRFSNVAYSELYVVSRGRLSDRDAVEVRGRFKTLDVFSAAFFLVDESRTTFAAVDSGLPLYSVRAQNNGGMPREVISNYLQAPTPHADMLTLIYRIRHSGGTGAATISEGEKVYGVTFQSTAGERIKTDAGEYDTTVVTVQSDYFNELGLKDVRINLSSDDARLPVMFRFRTAKGEFLSRLASVDIVVPEVEQTTEPRPAETPRPGPTPRPVVTPTPYIENQPLAAELAFELGESLNYQISTAGRPAGTMTIAAKHRKQFAGADSLLLSADITSVTGGPQGFAAGDFVRVQADPDTLAPQQFEMKFSGPLNIHNRTARFEQRGSVIMAGGNPIEAPVGTHSILSLFYAMRSFNLKPSGKTGNPVNDTKVAVFWDAQYLVFTLRPSPSAEITTIDGQKVFAQQISISTGNPALDRLNIKVWLGNDERRLPLRIAAGGYQADLITSASVPPK